MRGVDARNSTVTLNRGEFTLADLGDFRRQGGTVEVFAGTLNNQNTTFRLVWPGGTLEVDSPLIGRYNVSNLLAAIGR